MRDHCSQMVEVRDPISMANEMGAGLGGRGEGEPRERVPKGGRSRRR